MATLEPVDFDPFAPAPATGTAPAAPSVSLEPVDHDPFKPTVAKRGILAPSVEMSDGTVEIGLPEIIHAPLAGAKALWDTLAADPNADPSQYAGDAFNAATAAITGPVGAGVKAAAKAVVAPTATESAARLGVQMPRAATGGSATQALGTLAKEAPAPLTGNPLVKAAGESATALRDVGKQTLEGTGTGRPAQQGVKDWMSARGAGQEALEAEAGMVAKPKTMAAIEAPAVPEGASRIVTPDGSMEVVARPRLVELDDLNAAAGKFQPRDRTRGEYVSGVYERAARLDPEQLKPNRVSDSGAPLLLPDGKTIISGNGRVMSIAEVYRNPQLAERAAAYRASLGPEAANMRQPVRVMVTEGLGGDDAARFADLSNRGRIAQMSATERAARDAKSLGSDGVRLYQGGEFTAPQNEAFLRAFTSKAVASGEGAAFSKNGQLTQEGIQRMRNAVLASAYDDQALLSRLVESSDDNMRALTGALTDVSPKMSGLKADVASGAVKADLDPTKPLMEAVRKIADLRNKGSNPAQYFAQADAFDDLSPDAASWIRALYGDDLRRPLSRDKMTALLNAYADEAAKHAPGGLFDDPTTASDVLAVAMRAAGKDAAPVAADAAPVAARQAAPAPVADDVAAATSDDSLKAWSARPKTAQEVVFEARKAKLADALGMDANITPTAAINRIDEMMRSTASADVSGLLKAKKAVDAETWSDIGREILTRSGLGDDLTAFAASYGRMTDTAKKAMFGSDLKARLDDLANASQALGRLDQLATPELMTALDKVPIIGGLMANRFGQAGTLGAVAMVDGGLASLPTAAGSYAVTKFLSRPKGASALTRWMDALAARAGRMDASSNVAMTVAARNLAKELAEEADADQKRIEADLLAASEAMRGRR